MTDAGERSGGKRYSSSGARGREKGRRGKGRGEHKTRGEEKQDKCSGGKPDGWKPDSSKGASAKCERCGEAGHKRCAAPIKSAVFVAAKDTQLRYAQTSSLFLRAWR